MAPLHSLLVAALSLAVGTYYTGTWPFSPDSLNDAERFGCRPFLPKVFVETPPSTRHSAVSDAARKVDKFLSHRFTTGDIDSLSVAIVTSNGPLYERNWGVIRGNESESSPRTTSHASYRIASVSKLFTALEGIILEQKGVLSWYVFSPHACSSCLNAHAGMILLRSTSLISNTDWTASLQRRQPTTGRKHLLPCTNSQLICLVSVATGLQAQ